LTGKLFESGGIGEVDSWVIERFGEVGVNWVDGENVFDRLGRIGVGAVG
jgi:hypothetical protein